MMRCAGRTFDGHASVHSNAAWQRHAAASPSAQFRMASRSAPRGLLEHPLRVGERRRPHVGVVGGGHRARRQAQPAFDAVLEPLVVVDPVGRLGLRAGTRSSRTIGCGAVKRCENGAMSTTRSLSTGRFAMGSTVTVSRRSRTARDAGESLAAVHAHAAGAARCVEAGVAERQRAVLVHLDPAQGLEDRGRLVHRDLELVEAGRGVAAFEAEDAHGRTRRIRAGRGSAPARRDRRSCGEVGGVGEQDGVAGAAGGVDAELAARRRRRRARPCRAAWCPCRR